MIHIVAAMRAAMRRRERHRPRHVSQRREPGLLERLLRLLRRLFGRS